MKIFVAVFIGILIIGVELMAQEEKYILKENITFLKINEQELKYDMITLDDEKKNKPVVVVIHGGGWAGGNKESCIGFIQQLANWGYTSFAIEYRLAKPEDPLPVQIEDCKAAVRFIRNNAKKFNINPNKIAVMGHSAGGHLSSMLGTLPQGIFEGKGDNLSTSSAVQAVVSLAGPNDMVLAFEHFEGGNEAAEFIYGRKDELKYWQKITSPIHYVTKKSVPELLIYGSKDTLVPPVQGELLHRKMQLVGAYSEYYIIEGADHGIPWDKAASLIKPFLENFLGR